MDQTAISRGHSMHDDESNLLPRRKQGKTGPCLSKQ